MLHEDILKKVKAISILVDNAIIYIASYLNHFTWFFLIMQQCEILWSRKTIEYMYVYHFSWNFAHSSFCKAGKIAMQDIYTSLQLKQNTLLYVYDGVISTAGIQNAKCLTVSQICISSKKSVSSLAQFANRTQNSPLITKWFEKIMSYVLNFLFILPCDFLSMKSR